MKKIIFLVVVVISNVYGLLPVISPAEGVYTDSVVVAISCPGADSIFYTTDQSDPTSVSKRYVSPIKLYASSYVWAVAYANKIAGEIAMATFEISVTNPITVTSPNGGEIYTIGQTIPVTWSAKTQTVRSIIIHVSVDDGKSWLPIYELGLDPTSPQWGNYLWQIPDSLKVSATLAHKTLVTTTARIRIQDYSHADLKDQSDAVFTIKKASQNIVAPIGKKNSLQIFSGYVYKCNGARTPSKRATIPKKINLMRQSNNKTTLNIY